MGESVPGRENHMRYVTAGEQRIHCAPGGTERGSVRLENRAPVSKSRERNEAS